MQSVIQIFLKGISVIRYNQTKSEDDPSSTSNSAEQQEDKEVNVKLSELEK